MTKSTIPEGQWPKAARFWPRIGPPLRPNIEDLNYIIDKMKNQEDEALSILILGVTPEYYYLPWPTGSEIIALDCTPEMIEFVWPGSKEQAILGDWRNIPLPDNKFDMALCDGGLLLLDYPIGHESMAKELARILKPNGLAAFRIFTKPLEPEPPENVISDLLDKKIRDLNCLKLRLGNAMQKRTETGVVLSDIWNTLRINTFNWNDLSKHLGWDIENLEAIDAYQNNSACYHFLSTKEADNLFERNGFECVSRHSPTYLMGSQCPTHFYRSLKT